MTELERHEKSQAKREKLRKLFIRPQEWTNIALFDELLSVRSSTAPLLYSDISACSFPMHRSRRSQPNVIRLCITHFRHSAYSSTRGRSGYRWTNMPSSIKRFVPPSRSCAVMSTCSSRELTRSCRTSSLWVRPCVPCYWQSLTDDASPSSSVQVWPYFPRRLG